MEIVEFKQQPVKKLAYLILNGALQPSFLMAQLKNKTPIYCVDGAFNTLVHCDLPCMAVLGDLDSLAPTFRPSNIICLPDQDKTDLEKALLYLKDQYTEIHIYGAGGKQMDHFLGNLSVAKKYSTELTIRFHDIRYTFFYTPYPIKLYEVANKMISIVPFSSVDAITAVGLEYPLQQANLCLGGDIGIRNRAIQAEVGLDFKQGGIVIFIYH